MMIKCTNKKNNNKHKKDQLPEGVKVPKDARIVECDDGTPIVVERTINRRKMHQFQNNLATFPDHVQEAFNQYKSNNPQKANKT